ncbi:MAG: hypothetical protein V7K81_15030 [Nostoc sp.]
MNVEPLSMNVEPLSLNVEPLNMKLSVLTLPDLSHPPNAQCPMPNA